MAASNQWLYAISPDFIGNEQIPSIDGFGVKVRMPRRNNKRDLGTSFWISVDLPSGRSLPHFMQVGFGEDTDKKRWRGFYATTFKLSDPSRRDTVKNHGMDTILLPGEEAYLKMAWDYDHWRFALIPQLLTRGGKVSYVDMPKGLRHQVYSTPKPQISLVLESMEKPGWEDWNLSNYFAFMPQYRTTSGDIVDWPHARAGFRQNSPPSYIGINLIRRWRGLRKPLALQIGHLGTRYDQRKRLW